MVLIQNTPPVTIRTNTNAKKKDKDKEKEKERERDKSVKRHKKKRSKHMSTSPKVEGLIYDKMEQDLIKAAKQ